MNDVDIEDIIAEPDEPTWLAQLSNGLTVLQGNAWFIVAAAAFFYYIWKEKLSTKYHKWRESREIAEESAKMKKEPGLHMNREIARLNALKKLQEEYNKQALKMKEIEKENEEKKRKELLSKHKLQDGKKLNDDYFPLAGGSFRGYKAPRRTGCPGGSCNNR